MIVKGPLLQFRLKAGEIRRLRSAVNAAVRALQPLPAGAFSGDGITICAGGCRYFTNAWILIRLLRWMDCRLPIQLWHLGAREFDLRMERLVEPFDVECVNAINVRRRHPVNLTAGWPLKPYAIMHSPFRRVLALDADNFPVRDPAYLLELPAFRETGAIFWPDRGGTRADNSIWPIMGLPPCDEPEVESGQLLIDKTLCWEPLQLTMWMNEHSADFYRVLYGDKDTFRFAWKKLGRPYAMTRMPLQELHYPSGKRGVLCQHDLAGERVFQHRNHPKWDLLGQNPRVPGFIFEAECRAFLGELRAQWDGRIGPRRLAARGAQAVAVRRELTQGLFLIKSKRACCGQPLTHTPQPWSNGKSSSPDAAVAPEPVAASGPEAVDVSTLASTPRSGRGFRYLQISFCADGTIGMGAHPLFYWWDLERRSGRWRLTLSGENGPSALLGLTTEGDWTGRWRKPMNSGPVRLIRPAAMYPESALPLRSHVPAAVRLRHGRQPLPVACHARGIGDAIAGLYACAGAASAGRDIIYHTRHPQWLSRARHSGLTVTGDEPPQGTVDLDTDYLEQIVFARSKPRWYAQFIAAAAGGVRNARLYAALPFEPRRPAHIDRHIGIPRLDFTRYVILAPFAASEQRDWPAAHWRRLTTLLTAEGREVVAIGSASDEEKMRQTFENTDAWWVTGHPPEWVCDAMLGAEAVIGPDSGMIHLAGLLDVPALCLHSHLPPEFLFTCTRIVSLTPQTACVLCRWRPEHGFNRSCDAACSALATLGPEQVMIAFHRLARPA